MQWNKTDYIQYQKASEYIDNLLIPLMPFSLENNKETEKLASHGELIDIFSHEIEKNFKGRIFLMPSYNYLSTSSKENELTRINEWVYHAKENPFTYVFFLTFDPHWKQIESKLDGTLLWFPAVSIGNIDGEESKVIVRDQINQLNDLIQSYWNTK